MSFKLGILIVLLLVAFVSLVLSAVSLSDKLTTDSGKKARDWFGVLTGVGLLLCAGACALYEVRTGPKVGANEGGY